MKYIAIIPARGDSKRFPKKNLCEFRGKPLISHSIDYAQNCELINQIVVSTDNDEIKQFSLQAGVCVIDRPKELALDQTTTAEVLRHVVQLLIQQEVAFDNVVLLQPTNPLRPRNLLQEAIEKVEQLQLDSLMTVSRSERKLGKIINDKFVPWNYTFGQRSQELFPLYYENGLLYITSKELLLQGVVMNENTYPLVVTHPFGKVDIDTVDDINYAQYLAKIHVNDL